MKLSLNKIQSALRINEMADFVNARSAREKLLILGFGGLLLFGVDYFLWLSPVINSLSRTIPSYIGAETELQNMREDKKNEAEIKKRLERLEAELVVQEKGIEAADQIDALLEGLSKQASQSGVRITSLSPLDDGSSRHIGPYASLPIDIKATASTHELGGFVSSLETGETPYKVLNLKISENPQDPKKHLIQLKIETYRRSNP